MTIVDEEVVAQDDCGNNIKQSDGNEAGDKKGKKFMEIEEVIMDKADLMEVGQISGGRYDLRKRTGAMWRRTEPSLSRLRSAPKVSGDPLRAVSLKRSRVLVIYEGGHKADDAGKLGFMDRWHLEKPVGTRGGLLLLWDNSTEVRQILGNEFCIQVEIKGEWELERRHKRFQFSSQWPNIEGVQDAVKDGWQVEVEGSAMYQVHQMVKHTRMSLLAWHKPVHRNSEKVNLVIRNGQSTRLNEVNWVPGLSGKKPELRTEVDGRLFWVKDLMLAATRIAWQFRIIRVAGSRGRPRSIALGLEHRLGAEPARNTLSMPCKSPGVYKTSSRRKFMRCCRSSMQTYPGTRRHRLRSYRACRAHPCMQQPTVFEAIDSSPSIARTCRDQCSALHDRATGTIGCPRPHAALLGCICAGL
ncbi:glyoxalase 2-5 [Striga asiatica]|uniref:Glyoxalase 2-5 n=1 Tax=Striga asiatica TaxID=4170 RepID=A0A5A7QC63_STRAF|nr:glyoxalase 2-5 [Striga asiatica]